jgi:predicted metal-dependent phosphoesterase TrpH
VRADLHTHTTASDGTVTPAGLVALALDRGVDVLSITDHDSVEGLPAAAEAASGCPIILVPGVELSAVHDGRDVHVLGYFVDAEDPRLLGHLTDLRAARMRRARSMVDALAEAGYDVTLDEVLALSDGGAIGRSHIARALVRKGHADTVADAFGRLIGRGRPFYVGKDVRSPDEVVGVINDAGGIAVLAHPAVSGVEDLIGPLHEIGLGGVEAYHADHTEEQRAHLAAVARERGMLVTGGTDYHGPHAPNPDVGDVHVPVAAVEALLAEGAKRSAH